MNSSTPVTAVAVFFLLAAATASGRIRSVSDLKKGVQQVVSDMPRWP